MPFVRSVRSARQVRAKVPAQRGRALVVLDLNGTLLTTDYDGREYGKKYQPDFCEGHKNVYVRPFLHTFLDRLFSRYDVAVWTCNSIQYAQPIVERVFGPVHFQRLVFLWARNECVRVADSITHNRRMRLVKHMPTVWNTYPRYEPARVQLLDDNPRKAGVYSNTNLVHISTYNPAKQTPIDSALLDVLDTIDKRMALTATPGADGSTGSSVDVRDTTDAAGADAVTGPTDVTAATAATTATSVTHVTDDVTGADDNNDDNDTADSADFAAAAATVADAMLCA